MLLTQPSHSPSHHGAQGPRQLAKLHASSCRDERGRFCRDPLAIANELEIKMILDQMCIDVEIRLDVEIIKNTLDHICQDIECNIELEKLNEFIELDDTESLDEQEGNFIDVDLCGDSEHGTVHSSLKSKHQESLYDF
jgi:hypothetical protein